MKKLVFLLMVAVLISGCSANHANIAMPAVTKVYSTGFDNKAISYNILYSQPRPGITSDGDQLPLAPLNQAQVSVAAASTLKKLPDYIYEQLPSTVKRADAPAGDYYLVVELVAHHKKGPAYADYEAGKSFAKGMASFGFAAQEYQIVADFDVKYKLLKQGKEIFQKSYKVKDSVAHQKGKFDGFNTLNEYTSQILEKHLIITLNNFFNEATKAI